MKKLKVGFASLLLSTAAVAVLVQCAPKDSNKDKDAGKDKAVSAGVVDGMDFSTLDKIENRPNTKALLKALKDRTVPTASMLSMALVELHLQVDTKLNESADAKTKEQASAKIDAKEKDQVDAKAKEQAQAKAKEVNDKVLEKWEIVSKYADKIKAAKPEELKKVYELIQVEVKRDIRYNPTSVSILSALEKGEIEDYSGTSLLTLMWLQTGSLKRDKGVILFEEGLLKIAELRGIKNNVFSINTDTKDAVSKDLGTLDDLIKAGKSKLVQLDLFVIHETLKPFVADPKAWALSVQKASNKALGLKIEDKQLLTFDGADKSKLNHSALLVGKPRDNNTYDLQSEGTASGSNSSTATSVSGDGTASNVSGDNTAGSTSGDNTAGAASGDNTGAGGTPTAQGPGSVMYQSECVNMPEFRQAMAENKSKNLLSVFSWAVEGNRKFMSQANSSLIMARLEDLNEKFLANVDSDLAKMVADAKNAVQKDQKMRMILMVLPKGSSNSVGSLWKFDKETNNYIDGFGTVELKANASEYLRSLSRKTKASEDKYLIVETKQEVCP